MPSRRHFLATTLAAALCSTRAGAQQKRPRRILLKSGWQTVNIGDIGHTPGMLRLLAEFLPEVEITLWPNNIGDGVEELLRRNFPKVRIAQGDAVKDAFAECDFLLHGSGASFVAAKAVAQWAKETGKPYGVVGITFSGFTSERGNEHLAPSFREKSATQSTPSIESTQSIKETKDLCDGARFMFFRDSASLARARELGIACPIMDFGPDAAFGVNLRDDVKAAAFLAANDLHEGQFLCCIPRLRYTPYWLIPAKKAAFDERKNARNEEMKEHDHAPLRAAITEVVRKTPMKILLCPEDMTQMAVGKELIFDKLPEDVRPKVVWRQNYWLTDEALSTYVRSAGLFGNEMHSPIMALGNGVPAIVCRWAEQTTKGLMWRDIGLGDWLFDFDQEADVARLAPTVLALAQNPDAAKIKAARALAVVRERQKAVFAVVEKAIAGLDK